jgi:hypothetical protein
MGQGDRLRRHQARIVVALRAARLSGERFPSPTRAALARARMHACGGGLGSRVGVRPASVIPVAVGGTADPDALPADWSWNPIPARSAGINRAEERTDEPMAMEEYDAMTRKEPAVPCGAAPTGAAPSCTARNRTAPSRVPSTAAMPSAATPSAARLRRSRKRCGSKYRGANNRGAKYCRRCESSQFLLNHGEPLLIGRIVGQLISHVASNRNERCGAIFIPSIAD